MRFASPLNINSRAGKEEPRDGNKEVKEDTVGGMERLGEKEKERERWGQEEAAIHVINATRPMP